MKIRLTTNGTVGDDKTVLYEDDQRSHRPIVEIRLFVDFGTIKAMIVEHELDDRGQIVLDENREVKYLESEYAIESGVLDLVLHEGNSLQ